MNVYPLSIQDPFAYDCVSPNAIWAYNSEKDLVLLDLDTKSQLGKSYPDCTIDQVVDNGTVVIKKGKRKMEILAEGYAIIDSEGREIVPFGKFTFIGNFRNGLATYSTTGYGIPLGLSQNKYAQENAINGKAYAKWFELGNKYGQFGGVKSDPFTQGYINQKGEVIIPQKYVYAQPFDEDGYAIVGGPARRGSLGMGYTRTYSKIDKSGNTVATDLKVKTNHDCTLSER